MKTTQLTAFRHPATLSEQQPMEETDRAIGWAAAEPSIRLKETGNREEEALNTPILMRTHCPGIIFR
jgi:hypothetical protein